MKVIKIFCILALLCNINYAKDISYLKIPNLSVNTPLSVSVIKQHWGLDYFIMETKKELWKSIEGYEGHYQISSLGRVKSILRYVDAVRKGVNTQCLYNGGILKLCDNAYGYDIISLCIYNKVKTALVHRLVAKAHIPNPDNYPVVNHLDGNRKNNVVANLEWTTVKGNTQHAIRMGTFHNLLRSKPVSQFTLEGEYIASYESATEVTKTLGLSRKCIGRCCEGTARSSGGFKWAYKT